MMFYCPAYEDLRYGLLQEDDDDWNNIVKTEDRFNRFNSYTKDIITRRKGKETLDDNGSASSRLGTGNDGNTENHPGGCDPEK